MKNNHLWIKDTAYVGMYWWKREKITKGGHLKWTI